jgi:AraC-like DNA-binding protein
MYLTYPLEWAELRISCVRLLMASTLLHVGRLTFPAGWKAPSHRHPFTELLVILEGRMAVQTDRWSRDVSAGDVVAYPPELRHGEQAAIPHGGRIEMILLSGQMRASLDGVIADVCGRVRTLARWMVEEYSSTYAGRQQIAEIWCAALDAELQRLASDRAPEAFEDLRRFMRTRLKDAHAVEDLANRCHLSPFHFIRKYRGAVGRTPMEDLRHMRIEAACDLLLTTDWPLKRIADEVGFCDEYYFSRAFKQRMRVSPGTFRRRDARAP